MINFIIQSTFYTFQIADDSSTGACKSCNCWTCLNGGTCSVKNKNPACKCPSGFSGSHCQFTGKYTQSCSCKSIPLAQITELISSELNSFFNNIISQKAMRAILTHAKMVELVRKSNRQRKRKCSLCIPVLVLKNLLVKTVKQVIIKQNILRANCKIL